MSHKVIAFVGAKGVGKTSLAKILQHRFESCEIISFADPIRDMIVAMGVDIDLLRDPEKKEQEIDWLGSSPRRLMQTLGCEWGRQIIDENIWVKMTARRITQSKADVVIIDDCRFDNEASAIRKFSEGYVVNLHRPGFDEYTHEHDSEKGVSPSLVHYTFDVSEQRSAAEQIFRKFSPS